MLSFHSLWFLFLLPLPWVLFFVSKQRAEIQSAALKIPFFEKWQAIALQSSAGGMNPWRVTLLGLAYTLMVLALCGPTLPGKPMNITQKSRAIMMAVDISESMLIQDMEKNGQLVSRLEVVKNTAESFIQNRVGDRVGLILFGEIAYLQTPLTLDRKTVTFMMQDATVGIAGLMTALGDAIGLAIKQLILDDFNNRVLVLLTDGASNAGAVLPIEAAKVAAKNNIKIYTIGFGRQQSMQMMAGGIPIPVMGGNALDEGTLQKIANITGGRYFRAQDAKELSQVYQLLSELEPVSDKDKTLYHDIELYPWFVLASSLLFLLLLWREIKPIYRLGRHK